MEAIFATHNNHKLHEVAQMLPSWLHLKSLNDIGLTEEIVEDGSSLEENALIKARYVFSKKTSIGMAFADDTGLEVDALGGAPGIYSARYAGEHCSFKDNVDKLLRELQDVQDLEQRKARFRTVIALVLEGGEEHLFSGVVEGVIALSPSGVKGFGYDPIFIPNGFSESFSEMPLALKNSISHRGKAFQMMKQFLETYTDHEK
ncbi:MAG: RdgB/HAM1 family non-canonical purine NTP pyrophosphatase [Porphyromonas sp.]|nr:RdgB/HAM1 family non-canonical purine NTP pyrophosphatase [Porphyromonas sp.]